MKEVTSDSEYILKAALARFAGGWAAGRGASWKMLECPWCILWTRKGHGDPLLHLLLLCKGPIVAAPPFP